MKNVLTTTAAALVLGTAAFADTQNTVFSDLAFDETINVNASDLIGQRVYASEQSIETGMTIAAGAEAEWNDIGEINEVVLTRDGEVQSLIVGVGGFLGIGEKDVAINMSELRWVTEEGTEDDQFLVINATAVGVQDAPAYEYNLATNTMEDQQAGMETTGDAMMDGFVPADVDKLTAETLTGTSVYGSGDEDIGEISELLLTADGKLDRAVIDVGGLLGIGERPVALPMADLDIVQAESGDEIRVYINKSQEELEAMPEYEG